MGTKSMPVFFGASTMAVVMSLGSVSAMAAAEAAENVKVKKLTWAGCGISKNTFMSQRDSE